MKKIFIDWYWPFSCVAFLCLVAFAIAQMNWMRQRNKVINDGLTEWTNIFYVSTNPIKVDLTTHHKISDEYPVAKGKFTNWMEVAMGPREMTNRYWGESNWWEWNNEIIQSSKLSGTNFIRLTNGQFICFGASVVCRIKSDDDWLRITNSFKPSNTNLTFVDIFLEDPVSK